MGSFVENLKASLDNGITDAAEIEHINKINEITKEDIVNTEYHSEFNKQFLAYDKLMKKFAVDPEVAAEGNLEGKRLLLVLMRLIK